MSAEGNPASADGLCDSQPLPTVAGDSCSALSLVNGPHPGIRRSVSGGKGDTTPLALCAFLACPTCVLRGGILPGTPLLTASPWTGLQCGPVTSSFLELKPDQIPRTSLLVRHFRLGEICKKSFLSLPFPALPCPSLPFLCLCLCLSYSLINPSPKGTAVMRPGCRSPIWLPG